MIVPALMNKAFFNLLIFHEFQLRYIVVTSIHTQKAAIFTRKKT